MNPAVTSSTAITPTTPATSVAPRERDHHLLQRGLNVAVAVALILLLAPLLLVIAALIKLTSPGPVIYSQVRVGVDRRRRTPFDAEDERRRQDWGGTLFRIYKFRTMYDGADRMGQVWASPDDPRVTPVGRWLRRFRLDELPQLFNVVIGDMNIVGPRPEQPEIFLRLRREIPGLQSRQRIRPGITGRAQLNLRYDRDLDDVRMKLRLDLDYVARSCCLEDLKIMALTVPLMFTGTGW